ncbi:hypothetical protein EXIGLDRAFT_653271 [Exidia glandulosa HHB12029]|uniref:Response regulatory domain-containing protein n=1 Tax=Exidia glandulosa HHB12029 TaxID=1314781 RepID=A0A165EA24_EXIGL|nr:hypothetical protein EXIGLDRAFT_653271 [Exidia glandulosa HHB12029]
MNGVWKYPEGFTLALPLGRLRAPLEPVSTPRMSTSATRQLPAVRLPQALSPSGDLQASEKFELNWPQDPHLSPSTSRAAQLAADSDADGPATSSGSATAYPWHDPGEQNVEPDSTPISDVRDSSAQPVPRLSRAFSMPLPAQLGHLRHPTRHAMTPPVARQSNDYKELSLELADSVQMVIQTLLQLSPPHLLDLAKEQFAACAVQIPTPSISALLTSMKNLNYMSAHMPELSSPEPTSTASSSSSPPTEVVYADFDVGEMLQNVGDALSGVAAQAGVDLVLYHADVGMKHISVTGDECGLSYTLTYIVRQVLSVCRPGETVELGLQIVTAGAQTPAAFPDAPLDMTAPDLHSPALDAEGPLLISFDILHRLATPPNGRRKAPEEEEEPTVYPAIPDQPPDAEDDPQPTPPDEREQPDFSALLLRRLLKSIGASLKMQALPSNSKKRLAVLSLVLQRGALLVEPRPLSAVEEAARQPFPDLQLAREPTLVELAQFTETLRGKKVMFHANSSGSFARHLSSYLTSWGMDVSHVPTDDTEEKVAGMAVPLDQASTGSQRSDSGYGQDGQAGGPDSPRTAPSGPTFIVVDDDVQTLKRRLLQLRAQAPYMQFKPKRQRPSLAVHHRPRSSHAVRQFSSGLPSINEPDTPYQPVVFIHFTSLENYRYVKDMLQNTLSSPMGSISPLPEIIVVPKPAGPRRFLTALYTAVHKPIVDPFFLPIATSPMSPGTNTLTPFFSGAPSSMRHRQGSSASAGSGGGGSGTQRSPRIGAENALQPATPLAMDGIEYFSETAAKKVGGTPAAGVVIQSPDGRPAGIFFQPQPRLSRSGSQGSRTSYNNAHAQAASGRPSNGRQRRTNDDLPEAAKEILHLAGHVSQIPLDPTKLMRKTSNQPNSPFAFEVAGDTTSGEESGSAALPIPRVSIGPATPPSMRAPRRASSGFSVASASRATSPGGPGGEDMTIRAGQGGINLGRFARANSINSPTSPTTIADAAHALARNSVGRKSGSGLVESPTTSKAPPIPSPGATSAPTTPGQNRKMSRKGTEAVPPGQDLVSESSTRLPDRARKSKTVWKGTDIVPPINVLIVEDNMINRTILSTSLKKMGVKHGQAANGQEAIEKWRKGDFHLILVRCIHGLASTLRSRML